MLAVLLSWVLAPWIRGAPLIFFLAAVAVAAWSGGLRSGIVATLIGVIGVNVFAPTAARPDAAAGLGAALDLIVFGAVALLTSSLNAGLRRAFEQSERARAEAVSARQEAARRRDALLRIARLAGQVDAERLINDVLAEMVAVVGADAGGVYLWDDQQGGLVTVHNTLPTQIPLIRPGEGGAGRVWVSQEPLLLNDYQAESNVLPSVAGTGIRSGVVVPLNHEGRRLGTIGISSFDPNKRFTSEDAGTLQIFAGTAAATLVGIRQAQQLRASEERFRQLAENARDVVLRFRLKPDRAIEYVSPSVTGLTGYTPDELDAPYAPGQRWRLIHPDDQALLDDIEAAGVIPDRLLSIRLIHKDGSIVWTEQRRTPIYDETGVLIGYDAIIRDVTDRHQAEEERARRVAEEAARVEADKARQRFAFLADVSLTLAASLDYETTLQSVAQLAVPFVADWCAVDLAGEDGAVRQVALAHADPAKVAAAREIARRYPPDPDTPYGVPKVLRTGRPELYPAVEDAQLAAAARDQDHLALLRATESKSTLIVPLTARGRTLGALTLALTRSDRPFDAEDLAFAQDLGRRAALAVDNARLYHEAQNALEGLRREEERLGLLVEASGTLLPSLDLDTVLAAILDLARRLVDADAYAVWRCPPDTGQWQTVVAAGLSDEYRRRSIEAMPRGAPMPNAVLRISDIDREPMLDLHRDHQRAEGIRALLVVPLPIRGAISGTLAFYYRRPRDFEEAEVRLATALANLAAAAIGTTELYEEQIHLRTQAQEAVRLRDEFLSVAAHELKTPLTSLHGSTQLLLRRLDLDGQIDPARARRTLSIVEQQSTKLARLVTQLLDISRLESGKLTLEPQATDLARLVHGVADTLQEQTNVHPIRVAAPDPVEVEADPLRLEQVLINLIDNALKYSPAGGAIDVEVSAPVPGLARIAVRDRGPGIPPEHRDRIFERYYQAQTGGPIGLGLGLYISRQIVELHGGTIRAEFPADGGTRFVVTLPAQG